MGLLVDLIGLTNTKVSLPVLRCALVRIDETHGKAISMAEDELAQWHWANSDASKLTVISITPIRFTIS